MSCKRIVRVLLIVIVLGLGPAPIHANTPQTPTDCTTVADCMKEENNQEQSESNNGSVETVNTNSSVSSVGTMFKVLFALAFVVALLILVLKLLHKRTQVVQQGKGIQTLGGTMLGNHRSVQLVKVGNRILVVGVGDNVELIKEIEDPDEIDSLLRMNESPSSPGDSIKGLNSWFNALRNNDAQQGKSNFRNILDKQLSDSKQKRNSILEAMKKGHDND
ncbi:flagellar biosynthetic protein FliO [Pseudalkalibacillus sp. Hm43]|uniref:flagellar biosynthetic protein FliO n=1 Tax=Pseudalkalibacillus sp. Hm43 TaxID=3450742 RepID=UPI003F432608